MKAAMASIPPERDAMDIEFRRAVRIKIGDVSDAGPRASSLVAVCNKYDLIFVGFAQGFRVLRASSLDSRIVSSAKLSQNTVEDFSFLATVSLVGPPLHLAVSGDGLTLSVCVKKNGFIFAELYDIRAFAHQVSPPFYQVKLSSTADDCLMDLAWNPGPEFSSMFAACLSDGSVCLYEMKNTTLSILASLKGNAQATCLCWSPKGKQLVVGKSTGELVQYDQQLKEKKVIPFPADVYGGGSPCSVVDVFWESTQVFFVAYHPRGSESQEQPWLVMITATKEGISHVHHEDICYGSDNKSVALQRYYFHALPEWDMIICSSSTALETSVLGRQLGNKSVWERCNLTDAGRPEIPLVDYVEHFPRGVGISLNSAHPVEINETQSLPSCPLLLLLSTDGTLLCFHVIYLRPGAPAITVIADKLTTDGERKNLVAAVEPTSKASHPVTQGSQPAFGGQPSAGGQTIFGGQPPLGTQAVFGNQTSAGNQPAFGGQAGFGSLASTGSQPVFGGSTSGGGQLPFGGLSVLGNQTQTAFGSSQASPGGQLTFGGQAANIGQPPGGQFAQAVPPPKNQPHPGSLTTAGSNGQLPFGAGVQSTAQMRLPSQPPGSLTAASGDGSKPQLAFGFQPSKPANQPLNLAAQAIPSTAVGAEQVSLFSKPLQEASAATPKMPDLGKGLQTSTPFASTTPVSTSIFGTSLNLGRPLDQSTPAHALVKPSTTTAAAPGSVNFPSLPRPPPQTSGVAAKVLVSAGAGKSPVGQSAVAAVPPFGAKAFTTTKGDATQESVLQPGGRAVGKQSADQSDSPFWKYIIDEVNQFNREVHELRSRANGISVDIGSASEMETLRKKTNLESKLSKAVVEATHEKSEVVNEVKTQSLEAWALFEQCCRVKERNCDSNYEKLMRERPLNPECRRRLRTIHTVFQYVDSEQEKIDTRLDGEWEAYLKKRKNKRLLETPPMHAIYDALKSNNQTIRKQEMNLEAICARMQELNLCRSALRRNANLPFNSSTFTDNMVNGDGLTGDEDGSRSVLCGLRHKGPSATVIQEREAKVRQILSCRKAAPIVSTAPNNLSYSKIVSAKDLREILQPGNNPKESTSRNGSTTSTGPSPAAGIPGKSPTGRPVKAAVRSSSGQKETKPAEQKSSAGFSFPVQLTSAGRETGGGGLDLRNRQDPAKFFSQPSNGTTAVVGSGISQGNPVFGHEKSQVPAATGALFGKAFSATATALSQQTRAPAQAETDRSRFATQQMPQLPKYPSSGTSKTLESNPGQRKEGSFGAVPSSASRLPGFGALSGTSQLPRQLFHSPAAESAAAAAAEPSNSEYDDEDDENDDEEYGDGYNTDVSQELTEHEYDEAQPLPSTVAPPPKDMKRTMTQQKPIQNLFGLSSEQSSGPAPSSGGFVFGAKTDAEKAVAQSSPFAVAFGSTSGTSASTGGSFTATQSSTATTASSLFKSVAASSQGKSSSVLGGLLVGQTRDKQAVSAMSAGAFGQKTVSLTATGDAKNEAPDSQNKPPEEKTLVTGAGEVDANETKPAETVSEKNLPSELGQNSLSTANPETAVSLAVTIIATSATEAGLFGPAKTMSTGGTSLFGKAQTKTTAFGTSVFGQAQTTSATVGTSMFGQAQTTTTAFGTSLFGQAQTTSATSGTSVFGQAQTTSATSGTSVFGQAQTTTTAFGTSLFGQAQTTSATSGTSVFGQAQTTTTAFGTSLFGQAQNATPAGGTSVFGQAQSKTGAVETSVSGQAQTVATEGVTLPSQTAAITVGTGVCGQTQSATGAVETGASDQAHTLAADGVTLQGETVTITAGTDVSGPAQDATSAEGASAAATGLFGRVQTTVASGTSLSSQAQTTTSAAETSLSDPASTTTSTGGSSLSGQSSAIAANGTSLLGQAQTTTAGGTSLFGQSQTTISSGITGLFGQTGTTSGGTGLFGQAQTTSSANGSGLSGQAQSTTPSLFGLAQTSTAGGTGLFGQPPTTTSTSGTGLFGQPPTTTSTSGTGLFGQPPTTTSAGGAGLFGQGQAQATTSTGGTGLFGQPPTTTSTSGTGLFGQPPTTTSTSGTGLFGQPPTTTSAGGAGLFGQGQAQAKTSTGGTGLFGQPPTTTSTSGTGLFGQPPTTTSTGGTGLFGQPPTTTSTSGTGLFGQPPTTTSTSGTGLFGQPPTTTSTSGAGLFGQPPTTTSAGGAGLFGQAQATTSAGGAGLFGQGQAQATTSTGGTGLFGQPPTTASTSGTGLFGQPPTTTSAGGTGLFGQAPTTTSAGGTGLFGQAQTTASAAVVGTGLFGQGQPTTGAGGFGFGQPQSTGTGGLFGQGTSVSSFGQPSFGQPSFGQAFGQPAASTTAAAAGFGQTASGTGLFGQGAASNTPSTAPGTFGFGSPSAFGTSAASGQQGFGQTTSAFGAPAQTQGSLFGGSTSSGGGGGMFGGFGGLGRQPDPEKAKQNVFGSASTFGTAQPNTGLFTQTTSSPFGLVKTDASISGAFSAGGSSIQSSGFGGFQKPPQQPTSTFGSGPSFGSPAPGFGGAPAFGSPPAFGGAPAFGAPAAFGAAPAFGTPPAFGSPSTFGRSPGFGSGGAFSSSFGGAGGAGPAFGSSDTNSGAFANFASTAAPSFDALAMQSDQPTFGSPAQQPQQGFGGFGGAAGAGTGTFGSGFGSTGQNLPSTFSTYRS